MRRLRLVAGLVASLLVAACAAIPAASAPAGSLVPAGATAPGAAGSATPSGASSAPGPSAGAGQSPAAAASGGGTSGNGSTPSATPVPLSAPPRLVVSVSGTYDKTGNGPYAGSSDDYTITSTDLAIQPEAGGKVSVRGRITLTETEKIGTSLKCHGTFTASYAIATSGTISGDPAAPVYQIQIAVAHPPQDSIKLHCTTGISTSTFAHASTFAAWSGLLGAIDIPELGGSLKLSATGAIPYFGLSATASFSAHRG